MAFKRKRRVYKLDFSGTEYDGLEVRVSGLTAGEYLDIVMLGATDDPNSNETQRILQLFAKHLVSWNLEDEDEGPVSTTYEGVKSVDFAMAMAITNAWTDAMVNIPDATEKKSSSGLTFPEESIPTMAL